MSLCTRIKTYSAPSCNWAATRWNKAKACPSNKLVSWQHSRMIKADWKSRRHLIIENNRVSDSGRSRLRSSRPACHCIAPRYFVRITAPQADAKPITRLIDGRACALGKPDTEIHHAINVRWRRDENETRLSANPNRESFSVRASRGRPTASLLCRNYHCN